MTRRWLVLLALASPLAAEEPRADTEGIPLPGGCLTRLGSTRFRAWEKLNGPWFTPAGELLFTEDEGDAVHFRFMDARTGLFVRKVTVRGFDLAGRDAVQSVLGVSDDGRSYVVITAEARTRRVHVVTWDIAACRVVARTPIDVKSGLPTFSGNLRWFAHSDRDTGDVTVTDTRTGLTRRATRTDPDERPELFPAPDGKSVVVGTDTALTVFAVPSGKLVREVVRSEDGKALSGMRARYAADGRTVVIQEAGKDGGGLWRCDVRTGTVTRLEEKSAEFFVSSLSPDGSRMILGGREGQGDRLVRFSDGRRTEIVSSIRHRVPFSATGDRFVTLGDSAAIHDGDTGERLLAPAEPLPNAVQFHDGGRTVAGFSDNKVTLWDAATGRRVNRFYRPAEWQGLPFAGGRKVFAEVAPGDFVLTDPLTGRRDATNWKFLASAQAWQPTACGRFVVAAFSNDGQTRVQKFAVSSGEVVGEVHGLPIRIAAGLSISADGNRAVLWSAEYELPTGGYPLTGIAAGDLTGGRILHEHQAFTSGVRLQTSADGRRVLMLPRVADADSPCPVRPGIYDTGTGVKLADIDSRPPSATATSADSRAFGVGDAFGTVRVLEAATGGLRATFQHKDAITALAFSPDGTTLAAASNDAPLYLWDVRGTLRNLPKSFDPATSELLWAALANPDAAKAFDAMQRLAAAPADAMKLFARKQPPAVAPAAEWIAARRADLQSRAFADRERATGELAAVAEMVQPWLTEERKRATSPEVQRRLATAIAAVASNSAERLRALRSVEVLEWVRTPESVELLKAWTAGSARAPLSVAAGQALRRR